MSGAAEIIVIGAGIVGAACAQRLAGEGRRVLLLDNGVGGATWAGMGHLVCLDDSPAELALCRDSLLRWRALAPEMPQDCAWVGCGTVWVAETPDEMAAAVAKAELFAGLGIAAECLDADRLAGCEPALRRGLAGGLLVPDDAIVYAPNAAAWLIRRAGEAIDFRRAEVAALDGAAVVLRDGTRLQAPAVLVANGLDAVRLLPELPIRAKKGHLVISDRQPHGVRHQLVELGYGASAHAADGTSVAFNVQPRPTGQLLIGSSRQFDDTERTVRMSVVSQMLQRAAHFLPGLGGLNALRCWTGFRAASPDGLPLLGAHPGRPGVWVAVGHEGLGVTTAPASAEIIAALMDNRAPALDPAPYLAERYLATVEV